MKPIEGILGTAKECEDDSRLQHEIKAADSVEIWRCTWIWAPALPDVTRRDVCHVRDMAMSGDLGCNPICAHWPRMLAISILPPVPGRAVYIED